MKLPLEEHCLNGVDVSTCLCIMRLATVFTDATISEVVYFGSEVLRDMLGEMETRKVMLLRENLVNIQLKQISYETEQQLLC